MAGFLEGVDVHTCHHCNCRTFLLDDEVKIRGSAVDQALNAGCRFFEWILKTHPIPKGNRSLEQLLLRVICGSEGHLDFIWMDGHEVLSDSTHVTGYWPLHIFAPKTHPKGLANRLIVKPLISDPNSEESFDLIRSWVGQCDNDHSDCKKVRNSINAHNHPTRLIDLDGLESGNVRLHITAPNLTVRYTALSYCWGGDQDSKTTSAKLKDRCKGFPLRELPRTIQDAITVTQRLGLRYLWVDAICIIQDDGADKNREMMIMDQIYTGAYLTIVASRAEKADDGFLQLRNLNSLYGTVCQVKYGRVSGSDTETAQGFLPANPLLIAHDDPIDSRGWTFQERIRSFRTLQFGKRQTIWECPGCRTNPDVDGGDEASYQTSSESRFTGTVSDKPVPELLNNKYELGWILEVWQEFVKQYSKRTLTVKTDRLPAFAAMAEAFGKFLQLGPEQYLAGLWAFDLCAQLQWRRPRGKGKESSKDRHKPTWSWASLDGPVEYDLIRPVKGTDTLQVLKDECLVNLASPEFKYGRVESAQLMVCGYLRPSAYIKDKFVGSHRGGEPFVIPLVAYWDDYDEQRELETVWCLEINTSSSKREKMSCGLLLTEVEDNIFERLGYFEIHQKEGLSGPKILPNWFSDDEPKKICLK